MVTAGLNELNFIRKETIMPNFIPQRHHKAVQTEAEHELMAS